MDGFEIIIAIFWIFGIIGAVNKKKGNAGGSLKPAFSNKQKCHLPRAGRFKNCP